MDRFIQTAYNRFSNLISVLLLAGMAVVIVIATFCTLCGIDAMIKGAVNGGFVLSCASSDNLGHQSVLSFGGSGSSLIKFMRFQFRGASAA